jgi:hypothetical protein
MSNQLSSERFCSLANTRNPVRNFDFLLFPGVEELDFAGPWEMVGMWSAYFEWGNKGRIEGGRNGQV